MYKNKKILGLILARANSKRLPGKNFLKLSGKPLVAWTIEEALKSNILDNLILSTDDKKIINYTKKMNGLQTIKRSKKLSLDNTKSEDVVLDIINKSKTKFDVICLLQPTSPFRKFYDIDKSIKKMINEKRCAVISACYEDRYRKCPIDIKNGFFEKFSIKENLNGYSLNGAIYAADVSFFKKKRNFLTKETIIYSMPKSRSIDIDTKSDFLLAEKNLKK